MNDAATIPRKQPLSKADLAETNARLVELVTDLLHVLRETEDNSCAACGAPQGKQHYADHPCREIVQLRAESRYGRAVA
jgi:hypothetical protein